MKPALTMFGNTSTATALPRSSRAASFLAQRSVRAFLASRSSSSRLADPACGAASDARAAASSRVAMRTPVRCMMLLPLSLPLGHLDDSAMVRHLREALVDQRPLLAAYDRRTRVAAQPLWRGHLGDAALAHARRDRVRPGRSVEAMGRNG